MLNWIFVRAEKEGQLGANMNHLMEKELDETETPTLERDASYLSDSKDN